MLLSPLRLNPRLQLKQALVPFLLKTIFPLRGVSSGGQSFCPIITMFIIIIMAHMYILKCAIGINKIYSYSNVNFIT